jgi:uncharacterized protein
MICWAREEVKKSENSLCGIHARKYSICDGREDANRMNFKMTDYKWIICLAPCLLFGFSYGSVSDTTQAGIPMDTPWKKEVYRFSQEHFQHSAWGVAHYERVYLLSMEIAKSENLIIDTDVLFAAALLHDMGAFESFRKEGVDHARRSVQVVEEVLKKAGFPMDKLEAVQDAIRGHSYYDQPSERPESVVLHDADTLDFLGAMGIIRVVSITERGSWASDLPKALKTLKGFQKDLPSKLVTETAKWMGENRVREMELIFDMLDKASVGGRVL